MQVSLTDVILAHSQISSKRSNQIAPHLAAETSQVESYQSPHEEQNLAYNRLTGEDQQHSGDDGKTTTPFVCPICFKHFSGSWHVTRHLRTHTGEKPFNCRFCDYKTSDRSCIKRHVVALHPEMASVLDFNSRRLDPL